jgi:uncharacterized protein (TIGR03435 family)
LLVSYAYDVPVNPSPRLSGLPGWRETYDIEAKAPANAVPAGLPGGEKRRRVQGMVRRLLADRFKLVMGVEQKTMPVYALTVASGGPNLQKSTILEKDCMFDTGNPESCHHFVVGRGHPLDARAINMDDLAHYIENWADLPVVNRTALSGLFAVETEGWRPMRLPPPPPSGNPPAAGFDDLPTIFTVLRKLGLELKQQEAAVPVYNRLQNKQLGIAYAAVRISWLSPMLYGVSHNDMVSHAGEIRQLIFSAIDATWLKGPNARSSWPTSTSVIQAGARSASRHPAVTRPADATRSIAGSIW